MKLKLYQTGAGALQILTILMVASFFLLCAFKLVPVYAENRFIMTGIKSIAVDGDALAKMKKREIRSKLIRYYDLNNVRSEGAREIKIIRNSKGVIVQNKYEVRVPLLGNIDVMVRFNNVLDSTRFDECCSAPEED